MPKFLVDVGLSVLSGCLLFLSFPTFHFSGLAWCGFVPLLLALSRRGVWSSMVLSGLTTWVMSAGIFYSFWMVPSTTFFHCILFLSYLSLYGAVFGLGLAWLRTHYNMPLPICAPVLWVSLEYARGHASFLGAPMLFLGHSQYLQTSLIQMSSVTGAYGVSFLIMLLNATIALGIAGWRNAFSSAHVAKGPVIRGFVPCVFVVCLVMAAMSYGHWMMSQKADEEFVRIALLQPNIPPDQKWNTRLRDDIIRRQVRLARLAAQDDPQLIVWPETSVPGDVQHVKPLRTRFASLAVELQRYLLVGSAAMAKFSDKKLHGRNYNSLVLFTPTGEIGDVYQKIKLLPFGEYVPLRGVMPWPDNMASLPHDLVPGTDFTIFQLGHIPFGATICWENVFPEFFREFVRKGARFMVNATNEGDFGETNAPYQFLTMNVFRAVENRIAIARSANNGITAVIDPHGRILGRVEKDQKETFIEGHITIDIPLKHHHTTFYTLYGDVFGKLVLFSLLLLVVAALFSRVPGKIRSVRSLPDA